MKKIRIISLTICFILIFSLSGCSSDSKNGSEKEVIRVVYPTSRGMGDKDIAEFEEWFSNSFPNAQLDLISSAITTVSDAVKSEFRNDNGPDIFVTTEYDVFVNEGYMADITDVNALTKYRKSCIRSLERDGKVYALPLGGGVLVALYYNKTLFDEYGLEYPQSTEDIFQVVKRVSDVIEENDLDKRAVGASLLYPSQASAIMNGTFAKYTQTYDYLSWITDYGENDFSFENPVFQDYISSLDMLINKHKDDDGNKIPNTGILFGRDDYFSTQSSSISSFLNGASFMYIGDVNRVYSTFETEGIYEQSDIGLMGIPIGIEGVEYVSYMDELYMGINSNFDSYSDSKKEIILAILDYISDADDFTRNIFTFTGNYCSNYLEGQMIQKNDDPYFEKINDSISHNYVTQNTNNTPFSNIFGKIILAWEKGELDDLEEGEQSSCEKITEILENFCENGTNVFAKSEEPIGTSTHLMEYQSNIVRSQETDLGNQIADMAKDYMGADFALINAGGIRASIPEGNISAATINAVLPYENRLVKIKVSGATIKKALENAYNVGPVYKSGQFGDIAGLNVKLETNRSGYAIFTKKYDEWLAANPNASEIQKNAAQKDIVTDMCDENPDILNLKVISVTDESGQPIEDDKIYTLATLDYILKGGDGYDMLSILDSNEYTDNTIEVFDRDGNQITGTSEEMIETVQETCEKSSEAFVNWIKLGNVADSRKDGRISIKNFLYFE